MMSRLRIHGLGACIVAVLLFLGNPALSAEPSAPDRVSARQMMLQGRTRRHQGDLVGALESFRAADALMGAPTTGLELGRTLVALGRLLEADEVLAKLVRIAVAQDEPGPYQAAREAALELRGDLSKRIPTIRILLRSKPDTRKVQLFIDGVAVPQRAVGIARAVDPGRHVVEAHLGVWSKREDVEVAQGTSQEVYFELPSEIPQSPSNVKTVDTGVIVSDRTNTLAWIGWGIAGVGALVGTATGALAYQDRRELSSSCPGGDCPEDQSGRIDRAHRYASVSTGAFVVAGIGALVGVGTLVFDSPKNQVHPNQPVAVSQSCQTGMVCVGSSF